MQEYWRAQVILEKALRLQAPEVLLAGLAPYSRFYGSGTK